MLDIAFGVVSTVALHDGVENIACVRFAVLAVNDKIYLVGVGEVCDLLALVKQRLIYLLLLLGYHLVNAAARADDIERTVISEIIHRLRNDSRGIYLTDIELCSARSIAVGYLGIRISDDNRRCITQLLVGIDIGCSRAEQCDKKYQDSEALQISQDLKFFHLSFLSFFFLPSTAYATIAAPTQNTATSTAVFLSPIR